MATIAKKAIIQALIEGAPGTYDTLKKITAWDGKAVICHSAARPVDLAAGDLWVRPV